MHISLPIQMRQLSFTWEIEIDEYTMCFNQKQEYEVKNILMMDLFITKMNKLNYFGGLRGFIIIIYIFLVNCSFK